MRAKFAFLLSASLLTGAIAATAQPLPCASVAPEVRERVREVGACRDTTPDGASPKDASPAPAASVTMKLSDGTVVRVPREISSNINDGRKRAATSKSAPRTGESAQSKPGASGGSAPALQKLQVPDVIGRSYVDAGSALAEFKVDRIETANAAPAGEVLAQEPAPGTLVLPGSGVSLQVSDGSLASAADASSVTEPATTAASSVTEPGTTAASSVAEPATTAASSVTEPTTTAAPPSAPVPAADPAPATATAPAPATEPTVPTAPRAQFPIAFSANAALILGTGVLFGLLLGALLMRQWLLRGKLAADENTALPPTLYPHQQPVETGTDVSETGAAPEITFAARLDPGETTIALAPLPGGEEVAIEQSSDQHA